MTDAVTRWDGNCLAEEVIMFRALPVLAGLALASFSHAQVPDHLKCYKVKDPSARAEYTADLGGLAPEPGCLIRTPAKMLCVASTKANVAPTPPGAADGPAAGRFACYTVKCPKGELAAVPIVDQFGARDLQPRKAKLLCAPVAAPSTSTTTTTSSTTTTVACGDGTCCALSPPSNVMGCPSCVASCDAGLWPVSWNAVPGATHYIVEYTCFIQTTSYQTTNTSVDLCNEVGMCNDGSCANGAGPVTVQACDAMCCTSPVTVNPNETPITCGGGLCC